MDGLIIPPCRPCNNVYFTDRESDTQRVDMIFLKSTSLEVAALGFEERFIWLGNLTSLFLFTLTIFPPGLQILFDLLPESKLGPKKAR